MDKPILCLDFDGVCHSYSSGWKGANVIPDPPVSGLFEFLYQVEPYFAICVYSSRSNQEGGIKAMREWFIARFAEYQLGKLGSLPDQQTCDALISKLVSFPTEKPPAVIGLDDRVLTFDGTWPDLETLRTFKPWNLRAPTYRNLAGIDEYAFQVRVLCPSCQRNLHFSHKTIQLQLRAMICRECWCSNSNCPEFGRRWLLDMTTGVAQRFTTMANPMPMRGE